MKSVISFFIVHYTITFKACKYSQNIAQYTQKSKVAIRLSKVD